MEPLRQLSREAPASLGGVRILAPRGLAPAALCPGVRSSGCKATGAGHGEPGSGRGPLRSASRARGHRALGDTKPPA